MTETERHAERLQKISRRMRILILLLLIVSPLVFVWIVQWKGIAYALRLPSGAVDVSALSAVELAVVYALGALRPAVVWLSLVPLYSLFGLFQQGVIFKAANLRRVRQLGWVLIGIDIADMAQRFLTGPILSAFGAAEPFLHVGLVFSMAIVGLFVLVIAHVMEIGRRLEESDELTI